MQMYYQSMNLKITVINIEKKMFSFDFIYNLSIVKLKILRKYLNEFLIKEFIVSSTSQAKTSIFFAKKFGEDLRLYVNYKKLNAITMKNCYFIFFIGQFLDRLIDVIIFIKFDIITVYNIIRILKKNE